MRNEEWMPINLSYAVSSLGRVYSWKRGIFRKLKYTDKDGYFVLSLYRDNGERFTRRVHRFVTDAFLGLPPDGYTADHINRNRTDNRLENLRYIPAGDNAGQHATWRFGECHPRAKLTDDLVYWMRASGLSTSEIARWTNLGVSTIHSVRHNETWRHLL